MHVLLKRTWLSLCNLSVLVNTRISLFFFSFLPVICFPLSRLHASIVYIRCLLSLQSDCCSRLLSFGLDYLDHAARITYLVVNKTACIWSGIAAVISGLVNVYLLASLSSGTLYWIPKLLIFFPFFFFFVNYHLQTNIISETVTVAVSVEKKAVQIKGTGGQWEQATEIEPSSSH